MEEQRQSRHKAAASFGLEAGWRTVLPGGAPRGGRGVSVRLRRRAEAPDCHQEKARPGIAALWGRGPRRLSFLRLGPLGLPFCGVAAISRSRRGGGRGGAGERARAASGSEGGRIPFVLRLWALGSARAVPRPAPDTRRVRAACEPLKSSERRARSPEFFLLSKPLKSGIAHPHPCSVKGIDFTR